MKLGVEEYYFNLIKSELYQFFFYLTCRLESIS